MAITTNRAVRIDDALWVSAMRIATEQGTTVSDVVRDALNKYVDAAAESAPALNGLIEYVHQIRPGYTDAQVRRAVLDGIACFGINISDLSATDEKAIGNYCEGYLTHMQ